VVDEAVNIMGLKRFVSDLLMEEGMEELSDQPIDRPLVKPEPREERIAIIGAGPAGVTAARDLAREGYQVKVFDANPKPGGMMRVGIPPHRLSYEHLDREIQEIIAEGVELKMNTWVEDIPALLEEGYAAVLIATGAHQAIKVSLDNADHPDNWLSLDFLKKVCLGKKINLKGRKVIVLGGGDVAMDAARSAIRLGNPEVRIVCRGLRASFNEIEEAEEEGIEIIRNRVFKKVHLDKGKISGVECLEAEVGEVIDGKRQFSEIPDTEHIIPGDLVIWAIGQRPDFSFLPEDEEVVQYSSGGIQTDEQMMTTLDGVFTAGDVRRGTTFFVVDAVGEGHQVARSIKAYLQGSQSLTAHSPKQEVTLSQDEVQRRMDLRKEARAIRSTIQCIPVGERINNFVEVELSMTEKQARKEANRCLSCGPCSECMACLDVCEAGAVIHQEQETNFSLEVSGLIASEGIPKVSESGCLIPLLGEEPLAGASAAFEVLQSGNLPLLSPQNSVQDIDWQDQGIGLVVCQCGGEISRHVNTAGLCKEAEEWPEISKTLEISSGCSPEGAAHIQEFIRDHSLSRLILAACSCCSLDQVCYSCTFQRVRCKGNLGVFSDLQAMREIEFVNIREGSAYVHPRSRKKATQAARTLIKSALGHGPELHQISSLEKGLSPVTLVVGNGKSGEVCQAALSGSGFEVQRVEVLSGKIIRAGGRFTTPGPDGDLSGDCLVLAPSSGAELDFISGSVQLANQRPLLEGSPNSSSRRIGLFLCPPSLDSDVSGKGAAGEVLAWTGRIQRRRMQPAARIETTLCRSCGTCLEVCGLGIPDLLVDESGGHAWINPLLCLDCGTCTAHCPSGAIQPGLQTDQNLVGILERALV
jgi:NADPH-dependent glutamate synthase beta subunit-like oxidoreductase